MKSRLLLVSSVLAVALTLTVFAQEGGTAFVAPSRSVGEYAGVKPGSNNPPPRIARVNAARSKNTGRATLLTWPGFEQRQGGSSRFFLQVSSLIVTEQSSSNNRFELILRNASTHVRNTTRWLETRFFNTPVLRARVERRRRDLAVVFQMRANVTPQVSTAPGAGGFHFIFIDFPSGNYGPSAAERDTNPLPLAPGADDRPGTGLTDEEMRELNEESPPGM